MNWFASFTVLLTITQALVPATGKAPDNSTRNSHTQNQSADTSKNPAAPLGSPHAKDGNGPALKPDADKDSPNFNQSAVNITNPAPAPIVWRVREWVIWGANLALAIVGIGGIVVAIFTLCFIKRQAVEMLRQRITMEKTLNAIRQQASLMKVQSDQMERQVNASHDGLRAWVAGNVTEIEPIENPLGNRYPKQRRFQWQINNYGQTPAFIKLMTVEYSITDSADVIDIQKVPPRAINRFLGAGVIEKNILTIRTAELVNCDLRKRFWTVIIKVEYEDVFDRPHRSSASFSYYSPIGKGDPVAKGFYQGTDKSTNYNT
jgi:hypothetical protein